MIRGRNTPSARRPIGGSAGPSASGVGASRLRPSSRPHSTSPPPSGAAAPVAKAGELPSASATPPEAKVPCPHPHLTFTNLGGGSGAASDDDGNAEAAAVRAANAALGASLNSLQHRPTDGAVEDAAPEAAPPTHAEEPTAPQQQQPAPPVPQLVVDAVANEVAAVAADNDAPTTVPTTTTWRIEVFDGNTGKALYVTSVGPSDVSDTPARKITFGRSPKCDVITASALVSRVHCTLEVTLPSPTAAAVLRVVDTSANGTFVNKLKLLRRGREVRSGDVVNLWDPAAAKEGDTAPYVIKAARCDGGGGGGGVEDAARAATPMHSHPATASSTPGAKSSAVATPTATTPVAAAHETPRKAEEVTVVVVTPADPVTAVEGTDGAPATENGAAPLASSAAAVPPEAPSAADEPMSPQPAAPAVTTTPKARSRLTATALGSTARQRRPSPQPQPTTAVTSSQSPAHGRGSSLSVGPSPPRAASTARASAATSTASPSAVVQGRRSSLGGERNEPPAAPAVAPGRRSSIGSERQAPHAAAASHGLARVGSLTSVRSLVSEPAVATPRGGAAIPGAASSLTEAPLGSAAVVATRSPPTPTRQPRPSPPTPSRGAGDERHAMSLSALEDALAEAQDAATAAAARSDALVAEFGDWIDGAWTALAEAQQAVADAFAAAACAIVNATAEDAAMNALAASRGALLPLGDGPSLVLAQARAARELLSQRVFDVDASPTGTRGAAAAGGGGADESVGDAALRRAMQQAEATIAGLSPVPKVAADDDDVSQDGRAAASGKPSGSSTPRQPATARATQRATTAQAAIALAQRQAHTQQHRVKPGKRSGSQPAGEGAATASGFKNSLDGFLSQVKARETHWRGLAKREADSGEQLRARLAACETALEENAVLCRVAEELRAAVATASGERDGTAAALAKEQKRCAALSKQLDAAKADREADAAARAKAEANVKQLDAALTEAIALNERAAAQIDELEAAKAARETAAASEATAAASELEHLSNERDAAVERADDLGERLAAALAAASDHEQASVQLRAALDAANGELEGLREADRQREGQQSAQSTQTSGHAVVRTREEELQSQLQSLEERELIQRLQIVVAATSTIPSLATLIGSDNADGELAVTVYAAEPRVVAAEQGGDGKNNDADRRSVARSDDLGDGASDAEAATARGDADDDGASTAQRSVAERSVRSRATRDTTASRFLAAPRAAGTRAPGRSPQRGSGASLTSGQLASHTRATAPPETVIVPKRVVMRSLLNAAELFHVGGHPIVGGAPERIAAAVASAGSPGERRQQHSALTAAVASGETTPLNARVAALLAELANHEGRLAKARDATAAAEREQRATVEALRLERIQTNENAAALAASKDRVAAELAVSAQLRERVQELETSLSQAEDHVALLEGQLAAARRAASAGDGTAFVQTPVPAHPVSVPGFDMATQTEGPVSFASDGSPSRRSQPFTPAAADGLRALLQHHHDRHGANLGDPVAVPPAGPLSDAERQQHLDVIKQLSEALAEATQYARQTESDLDRCREELEAALGPKPEVTDRWTQLRVEHPPLERLAPPTHHVTTADAAEGTAEDEVLLGALAEMDHAAFRRDLHASPGDRTRMSSPILKGRSLRQLVADASAGSTAALDAMHERLRLLEGALQRADNPRLQAGLQAEIDALHEALLPHDARAGEASLLEQLAAASRGNSPQRRTASASPPPPPAAHVAGTNPATRLRAGGGKFVSAYPATRDMLHHQGARAYAGAGVPPPPGFVAASSPPKQKQTPRRVASSSTPRGGATGRTPPAATHVGDAYHMH